MLTSGHKYDCEDRNPGACEQAGYGCGSTFGSFDIEVGHINSPPVACGGLDTITVFPRAVFTGERSQDKSDDEASDECGKSVSFHPITIAEPRSQ